MERLFIQDKNDVNVPVAELGLIAGKQQTVLGNAERDLILRTQGGIKVQVGNKFYDIPLTLAGSSSTITGSVIVLATNSDLAALAYPGEGILVYVNDDKSFYITYGNSYIKINQAQEDDEGGDGKLYLAYNETQELEGTEKRTVLLNSGYLIPTLNDVTLFDLSNVYEGQLIFSIEDKKHYAYESGDPSDPLNWKELYLAKQGGTVTGSIIVDSTTSGYIQIKGDYLSNYLPPNESKFKGYYLGKDFTKGLAMWNNGNESYISSQDPNGGVIRFITGGSSQVYQNPLSIGANNVGVGAIDYAYNFNVSGTSNFVDTVYINKELKSKDFVSGLSGQGYALTKNYNNDWTLEVDNLIVRNNADTSITYKSNAVDGSLILNFSTIVLTAFLVESFGVYLDKTKVGRYSSNGVEFKLKDRSHYANVVRINPAIIDEEDVDEVKTLNLIDLAFGIGDKDSTGNSVGYSLLNKNSNGNLFTPTGEYNYDAGTNSFIPVTNGNLVEAFSINLYQVNLNTDHSSVKLGDLYFYRYWDEDKNVTKTSYVEVIKKSGNSVYVYAYDSGLNSETKLIKLGNRFDEECLIQLNGADSNSPFIEMSSNITSFNEFIDNIYFDEELIETGLKTQTDQLRLRVGDLSDIVDEDLGLVEDNLEKGFYSDNAYIKGNYVGTKMILGTELDYENGVLWIKDLETIKSRNITGSDGLNGGGNLFANNINIKHNVGTWTSKTALTGNSFISNLLVDQYGHLTNWTTRAISTSEIPEGSNLYYTNARVKLYADTLYSKLGHTHLWAEITNRPTNLSQFIDDLNYVTPEELADVHIGIANSAGVPQFNLYNQNLLRFEGTGDTSISYDPATNKVIITSTPGAGTGGAVTSFNGRTGPVSSAAGDYTTSQVTEFGNLYFTNARVQTFADTRYSLLGHTHTWAQITDRPTNLSQFTNDLGNYGNWITFAQGDTRWLIADGATYAGFAGNSIDAPYMRHTTSNSVVTLARSGGENASGTWGINITGTAERVNIVNNDSTGMRFHWNGQSGQPQWLWGSSTAEDMYVYNPSNFNVANSVAWNGQNYHGEGTPTVNSFLMAYSPSNRWQPAASGAVQAWLGLGSLAYINNGDNIASFTTGGASFSNYVISPDGSRVPNDIHPSANPNRVRFDFVNANLINSGGNYGGVMTFSPWTGTIASTGDASYQLAFGSAFLNATGVPQLRVRNGIETTWNSWYSIYTSANTAEIKSDLGLGDYNSGAYMKIIGNAGYDANTQNINGGGKLFAGSNVPSGGNDYGPFLSYGVDVYTTQFSAPPNANARVSVRTNGDGGIGSWQTIVTDNILGSLAYRSEVPSTSETPWTLAQRDSGGNLNAVYYKMTGPAVDAIGVSDIVTTAGDGYLRRSSAATVKSFLGLTSMASENYLLYHRYNTFTADANTVPEHTSNFTYAVNAPYNGYLGHFGAQGYGLQLNGQYGDGRRLAMRLKNGDATAWNPWFNLYHSGDTNQVKSDLGLGSLAYRSTLTGADINNPMTDSTQDINVSRMLRWKNYGNDHVIFDASNGTAPNGTAIDRTNPQHTWSAALPNLMGWNGVATYAVRVDSSRYSEQSVVAERLKSYNGTNGINWGWDGSNVTFKVDNSDFGNSVPMNIRGSASAETLDTVAARNSNLYRTITLHNGASLQQVSADAPYYTAVQNQRSDIYHKYISRLSDGAALSWRENWWDGAAYHSLAATSVGFLSSSRWRIGGGTGNQYDQATVELLGDGAIRPRLGFHMQGVVASSITIATDGTIEITNNPGTAHEKFRASQVEGTILVGGGRIFTGYDSGVNGSVSCSNWFRSGGSSGWINDTYGGGVYMSDTTWVRVYGSKPFWVDAQVRAVEYQTMGGNYNVNDYGLGLVGLYDASRYQSVFSMGASYRPAADGTSLANSYGIVWTHTNVGGQSKAGLGHQMLITEAGVTQTAIGNGIWTRAGISAGTGTNGGFSNNEYAQGHNNIWRLANAVEFGIGYYQAWSPVGGNDAIGFHFGDRNNPRFYVSTQGNAQFSGYVTASGGGGTSDIRYKNLVNNNLDLTWLDKDRTIAFTWKNGLDTKVHYGYSAQEIDSWCPDLVFKENPEKLALNQVELLTLEVKRLKERVTELENGI